MAGCVPVGLISDHHTTVQSELHGVGWRFGRGLPPGRRAAGLRQADGMTHKAQALQDRCGPAAANGGITSGSASTYIAALDSADGPPRQHPDRRTRVHNEALAAFTG